MRKSLVAICWSLCAAVVLPNAAAANEVMVPATHVSPLPLASGAPSNVKSTGTSNPSTRAPHLFSAGHKSLPTYGYMKQASDDRDGLARLQDQARQLRPPR